MTDYNARKIKLEGLKESLLSRKNELFDALDLDFGKGVGETSLTELFPAMNSIDHFLKNLKKLMKPVKIDTPISFLGSSSYMQPMPKGKVLVISPWNYPFLLAIDPVICALAAGNKVDLAPSEMTPNTSQFLKSLLEECLEKDVRVHLGGKETVQKLLEKQYDHIFFTGSTKVGQIVMEAAAKKLCPVTLELGGKSPAIVDASADLSSAAQKLIWGKRLNSSQTCVAPDYIYVEKKVAQNFYEELCKQARIFEEEYPQANMITDSHLDRLDKMTKADLDKGAELIYAGNDDFERRKFGLKILTNVKWSHETMQEEIFGPILPCLEFDSFADVIDTINEKEAPLASYLFSNNKENIDKFESKLLSGGACVNHTILHLANHNLAFGGVGKSGMGRYHGDWGFKEFSHYKSIFKAGPIDTMKMFYNMQNKDRIEKLLKWLGKLH